VILALMGLRAIPEAGPAWRITLIPCGPVAPEVLSSLATGLRRELAAETVLGKEIPVPAPAYVPERRQYLAGEFLPWLSPLRLSPRDLVLGVTGADLYVPGLNFVFGLADPGQKTAIISLARLHPEISGQPRNPRLLQERALKEAVHELGHLLGLPHCRHSTCIMFFSNTLSDTDRKGPGFCLDCRRRWER
jgi:archaemetzincin